MKGVALCSSMVSGPPSPVVPALCLLLISPADAMRENVTHTDGYSVDMNWLGKGRAKWSDLSSSCYRAKCNLEVRGQR